MKTQQQTLMVLVAFLLLAAVPTPSLTQIPILRDATAMEDVMPIKVYFRNNKARFKSVQLVHYAPKAERGTLESHFLLPWQRFSFQAALGTKIFFVDEESLRKFESGGDLREGTASITLRDSDAGQTYDIYKM